MNICKDKHMAITYMTTTCPLCRLVKHNNIVHDFIESKSLERELVEFQKEQKQEEK